jgi:hypothetical protein
VKIEVETAYAVPKRDRQVRVEYKTIEKARAGDRTTKDEVAA